MNRVLALSLVVGLLALLSPPTAHAEDEPAWKADEVARVNDAAITWDELCRAAVDHLGPALQVPESTASLVLERLIRERAVAAECTRRGLAATPEEIEAGWADLDARTRAATQGAKGLREVMAEHVVAESAVRARLSDEIRGRKLVDAGVSPVKLLETARVILYLPTARGPADAGGAPGAALVVEGLAIDRTELGRRLLANLGAGRVRSILDAECRARLAAEDRLTPDAMVLELKYQERIGALEARFDPEPVWETVFLHRGRTERHERTSEALPESPYARSLFGLLKRFREEATADDVRLAWRRGKEEVYGPHLLATELEIRFRARGDEAFGNAPSRTRREALRLARALATELEAGRRFDDLALRFNDDPDVSVKKLRLYQTDRSQLLLDRALKLEDGELAPPFETLSEVHLLRREALMAAEPFEILEPLVRERLARDRVRLFLDDAMEDPDMVRLRWPLPLMP